MTDQERELLRVCAEAIHAITSHRFFAPAFGDLPKRIEALLGSIYKEPPMEREP